ncbi:MAG: hypothetical protein IJX08_02760 [Clostridia bacterium]|nr:hypothetical protein [Clostridia bacterium]
MGTRDLEYYKILKKLTALSMEDPLVSALVQSDGTRELALQETQCRADEEWILKIEEGLPYIAAAIEENRRHLKTEGRIVPIERARRVGKASVFHLAAHSNLIAQVEEEQIKPEKLYVVENSDDYALYENRFLYLTLRTIENFAGLRLKKIAHAQGMVQRTLHTEQTLRYHEQELSLVQTLKNESNEGEKTGQMRRVEDILKQVHALCSCELMRLVASTPMIKPPVVRTNVLKSNKNFKAALALYEYLSAFEGEGFWVSRAQEQRTEAQESLLWTFFSATALQELALRLQSDALRERLAKELHEEQEQVRKEEEQARAALLQRAKEKGAGTEELLAALCMLEEENEKQKKALARQEQELVKASLREKSTLERLTAEYDLKLRKEQQALEEQQQRYTLTLAQLDALRSHYNLIDPLDLSYTERERFDLLEKEQKALNELIEKQWKKSKRVIRSRILFGKK